MARRKSIQTQRRANARPLLSRVIWIVWTLVTGGSVAGWMAPDMPLVGPLVQTRPGQQDGQRDSGQRDRQRSDPDAPDTAWQGKVGILEKKLAQAAVVQSAVTAGDQAQSRCRQTPVRSTDTSSYTPGAPIQKPADAIRIASYNIQVFGTSKLAKTWVVDILAKVVRHFDIVAIQEVRAQGRPDPAELRGGDQRGRQPLRFRDRPALGTHRQHRAVRVRVRHESHRGRSLVGRQPCRIRPTCCIANRWWRGFARASTAPAQPFSFWLVNIHTDPDEVKSEINVLAGVFQVMQTARAGRR